MSQISNESAPDKAARLGLIMRQPLPDQLLVDLDSSMAVEVFRDRLRLLRQIWPFIEVSYTKSLHGNTHAYITMKGVGQLSPTERVALQAAVGSDPLREMLAIHRLRTENYEFPSVLFEKE